MTLPPFLRYLTVGVGAFVFDYLLFIFCLQILGINYLLANALGYAAGFLLSFFLNGRYTFAIRDELGRSFLRYCLLALFSLCMGSVLLHLLVQGVAIAPEYAKVLVSAMTVCWNFLLYRYFVFREAVA